MSPYEIPSVCVTVHGGTLQQFLVRRSKLYSEYCM